MAAGVRDRQRGARSPAPLISTIPHRLAAGRPSLALVAAMPVLAVGRAGLVALGVPDYAAGSIFAIGLLAMVALVGRVGLGGAVRRPPLWMALGGGLVLGAGLLLPGRLLHAERLPLAAVDGQAFQLWAPATAVVVVAEEAFLRARLQPLLTAQLGANPAIWLAALVFALAHVPLYGLVALPLDLGVGLLLGALRQWSGRVAPAMLAHAIADLGWWSLG